MSAGTNVELMVQRSLDHCAPRFAFAVNASILACNSEGLDAYVYESVRSNALQHLYYERGVTRAKDALHGWHFYGLAVDVISLSRGWEVSTQWRRRVTEIFKAHGLKWGGDWPTFKDQPHYQWALCKNSPSDRARELYAEGGLPLVWQVVGAAA